MKWHDYETIYQATKRLGFTTPKQSMAEWTDLQCTHLTDRLEHLLLRKERSWCDNKRPYYSVYPQILPGLMKLKLSLDPKHVVPQLPQLLVRFQQGGEIDAAGSKIRSVLTATATSDEGWQGLMLAVDTGRQHQGGPSPLFAVVALLPGSDLETELGKNLQGFSGQDCDILRAALRIASAVSLIDSTDSDLIEPEVLSADMGTFQDASPEMKAKILQRAKNRGKVGWVIGRKAESCPHYRHPHLSHRWVGKGRTQLRPVIVKGSIVHRWVVKDVPTGYLDAPLCPSCKKLPVVLDVEGGLCEPCAAELALMGAA